MRTRFLVAAIAALSSVLALVGAGAQHQNYSGFGGRYQLGLAYMAPPGTPTLPSNATGIEEPVFGVIICDGQNADTPTAGGAGGNCPTVTVSPGDTVNAYVMDSRNMSGEVSFAACVDTDWDGNCRPEDPDDYLHFYSCSGIPDPGKRRGSFLTFKHNGPPGPLAIFLMQQADQTGACAAIEGFVDGVVISASGLPPQCSDGKDNDGNGLVDWPSDPGCTDPNDDVEWVPPPGYTH